MIIVCLQLSIAARVNGQRAPEGVSDTRDVLSIVDIFQQEGNTGEALAILSEAVLEHPGNPDFLYRLGILQAKEGMSDQCRDTFSRALKLDPGHRDSRYAKIFMRLNSIRERVDDGKGEEESVSEEKVSSILPVVKTEVPETTGGKQPVEIIFEFKNKPLAEVITEMQHWRQKLDFNYDKRTGIVSVASEEHKILLRVGKVHIWHDQEYGQMSEPPRLEDSVVYVPEEVLVYLDD